MRVGCNTIRVALDEPNKRTLEETIIGIKEAGFESVDLGLGSVEEEDWFLFADDWERRVDELGELAAKLGIIYSQLHIPFASRGDNAKDKRFRQPGFRERFEEGTRLAYLAGARLGIPWAVAHPISPGEIAGDVEACMRANHEFYDRFVELGIQHGIGTAFENMIRNTHTPNGLKVRYCADYEELIEFVDSYNDPMVQICLDTGHANISGLNLADTVHAMGSRLKVVHFNDNFVVGDHHVAPLTGTIDWKRLIRAMADVGYEGVLNLEIGGYLKRATREMQKHLMKAAYVSGDYLRQMFYAAQGKNEG